MDGWMDGWIDGLQIYVLINSISVISGRWDGDNERMFAMEPCFRMKRLSSSAGIEAGTARSATH